MQSPESKPTEMITVPEGLLPERAETSDTPKPLHFGEKESYAPRIAELNLTPEQTAAKLGEMRANETQIRAAAALVKQALGEPRQ